MGIGHTALYPRPKRRGFTALQDKIPDISPLAMNDRWLLPAGEILGAVYPDKKTARSQRTQNLFSGNTEWKDYIANPEKGKYGFRSPELRQRSRVASMTLQRVASCLWLRYATSILVSLPNELAGVMKALFRPRAKRYGGAEGYPPEAGANRASLTGAMLCFAP